MGGRGSQGARLKSSLREGAPSPVRGGGCRLAVARLGHLKGKRGRQGGFAALRWSGRRIGSGRVFRPDGKHLASRARLFDPEPRAPAGSGTRPSDPLHGASRTQPLMKILGLARLGRRAHDPARTAAMNLILHSEPWHAEPASCPVAARTASRLHNRRLGRVPREAGQQRYGSG
jgi:hypothetical protein